MGAGIHPRRLRGPRRCSAGPPTWQAPPVQDFDLIIVGTGSGQRHPRRAGRLAHRDRRARRVRGHVPQRGLHPVEDVRLRRRRRRRAASPSARRPRRRSTRSTGRRSSSGSSAASTPSPPAASATAREDCPTSPCSGAAAASSTTRCSRSTASSSAPTASCSPPAPGRSPDVPGLDDVATTRPTRSCASTELPGRWRSWAAATSPPSSATCSARFGTQVTFIIRGAQLLRAEDDDVSPALHRARRRPLRPAPRHRGHPGRRAGPAGHRARRPHEADGDRTLEADVLLVATGRIPNGDQLAVERHRRAASTRPDGSSSTRTCETDVEGIWALGDLTNRYQLKHLANAEATVVVPQHRPPRRPAARWTTALVPHAVFGHPQIAGGRAHRARSRRRTACPT